MRNCVLSIAQERSPKYADKFLDKVKPLLVEPKVGRRSDGRLFFFVFPVLHLVICNNVYLYMCV